MKTKSLIVLILLSFFPISSYATYVCTGSVHSYQVNDISRVYIYSSEIYGDGTGHAICDMDGDWKGVSAQVCKLWFATILTATATGQDLKVQYQDDGNSCDTMPAWSSANVPYALRLYD